jgi:hypothetical protein
VAPARRVRACRCPTSPFRSSRMTARPRQVFPGRAPYRIALSTSGLKSHCVVKTKSPLSAATMMRPLTAIGV